MEKNIVVIDLEKYEKLIRDLECNKVKIKELEKICNLLGTQKNAVDSNITDRIYKESSWELSNIVKSGKEDNRYSINNIIEAYKGYGYSSMDYINSCIDKLIERYEKAKAKEDSKN